MLWTLPSGKCYRSQRGSDRILSKPPQRRLSILRSQIHLRRSFRWHLLHRGRFPRLSASEQKNFDLPPGVAFVPSKLQLDLLVDPLLVLLLGCHEARHLGDREEVPDLDKTCCKLDGSLLRCHCPSCRNGHKLRFTQLTIPSENTHLRSALCPTF